MQPYNHGVSYAPVPLWGKSGALGLSREQHEVAGQCSARSHSHDILVALPLAPCLSRNSSSDPREDEEESEGSQRKQDLKETYIRITQGVQEWQDGSVYKGDFGLDMKLGFGEFSWPTGEVGGFSRGLSPVSRCCGIGFRLSIEESQRTSLRMSAKVMSCHGFLGIMGGVGKAVTEEDHFLSCVNVLLFKIFVFVF